MYRSHTALLWRAARTRGAADLAAQVEAFAPACAHSDSHTACASSRVLAARSSEAQQITGPRPLWDEQLAHAHGASLGCMSRAYSSRSARQQQRSARPTDSRQPGTGNPAAALTRSIAQAATAAELVATVQQQGKRFNSLHIAATLHRAAKLLAALQAADGRAPPAKDGVASAQDALQLQQLMLKLAAPFARSIGSYGLPDLTACLGSYAMAGVVPPDELMAALRTELLTWGKLSIPGPGDSASPGGDRRRRQGAAGGPPQALAQLAWALGKMGRGREAEPQLWQAIADHAAQHLPAFSERSAAQLLWGFAKAGVRDERLLAAMAAATEAALAPLVEEQQQEQHKAAGDTGSGSSRRSGSGQAGLSPAGGSAAWQLSRGGPAPQTLASLTWGFATLKWQSESAAVYPCLAAVAAAKPRVWDFDQRQLTNMLWGLATQQQQQQQQEEGVGSSSSRPHGSNCSRSPQSIGGILRSAASLAGAAQRRANEMTISSLAVSMWSVATLLHTQSQATGGAAAGQLPDFGAAAELAGAYDDLARLLNRRLGAALAGAGLGPPQHAAAPLLAAPGEGQADAAGAQLRAQQAAAAWCQVSSSVKPADISMAAWSVATARSHQPGLLAGLAVAVTAAAAAGAMGVADLSRTAWALARAAGERDGACFAAMGDAVVAAVARRPQQEGGPGAHEGRRGGAGRPKGQALAPSDVRALAWAYATAGQGHAALHGVLLDHLARHAARYDAPTLAVAVWGLTQMAAAAEAAGAGQPTGEGGSEGHPQEACSSSGRGGSGDGSGAAAPWKKLLRACASGSLAAPHLPRLLGALAAFPAAAWEDAAACRLLAGVLQRVDAQLLGGQAPEQLSRLAQLARQLPQQAPAAAGRQPDAGWVQEGRGEGDDLQAAMRALAARVADAMRSCQPPPEAAQVAAVEQLLAA